ncbi:MAG: TadE/TadG family type IV pilus assembly protein [Alteraurantiacibacter sp.]
MRRLLSAISRDERGVSVVEFALIAPVFLMTLMGLFDFSYNYYTKALLEGALQKAARDSGIEAFATNPAALDTKVKKTVQNLVPSSTVTVTRAAYSSYSDVGKAEEYTDTNDNDICDNNEPFEDANGNGRWDRDRSLGDSSGARDAVVLSVDMTYDRMFPLTGFLGFESQVTLNAQTVLRNQPFNVQADVATVGNCD